MPGLKIPKSNAKENGNYYIIVGYTRGYIGMMEKKTETTKLLKGILG